MITAALQKAIDNLKIYDVYVRDQMAGCAEGFDPKYAPNLDELLVEQMHVVRRSDVVEVDGGAQLLRVFVRLGARWVEAGDKSEEPSIKAIIEAEYVAEYAMAVELDQDSINEFCLKNVSYHVWPYWRELLSSQCARMHLPRLILPAIQLASNRHQETGNVAPAPD